MAETFDQLTRILGSGLSRRDTLRLVAGTALASLFPRAARAAACPTVDCPTKPVRCEASNRAKCLSRKRYKGCFYTNTQQCWDFPKEIQICSYTREEIEQDCPAQFPICKEFGESVLCLECEEKEDCKKKGSKVCCAFECCPKVQETCCGDPGVCCTACQECKNGKCVDTHCKKEKKKTQCCPKTDGSGHYCCLPNECCGSDNKCRVRTGVRESRIDEVASAAQAVQMSVTVRDQRGIGTITPVKQDNATLDIPPFQPGDTEVVVTATKIDAKKRAFVQLQVCPPGSCGCAGCCGLIDPVVAELRIPAGRGRVRESFSDIPVFEHLLVVQNGSPGLRSVRINVNGRWVGWLHLGPDEIQTVDLEPYMLQAANVVTLIGAGAPGSSALALISDLPAAGDGAGTAVLPSRVRWQPATQQADLDLHWGH